MPTSNVLCCPILYRAVLKLLVQIHCKNNVYLAGERNGTHMEIMVKLAMLGRKQCNAYSEAYMYTYSAVI